METTYTEVPAAEVAALLKAKASDLNWYTRTIRNAIRGAKRNERSYFIGRTYTQAHITEKPGDNVGLSVDYRADADGRLFRASVA